MSIKIMSWVWESGPSRQADRFVLLALADFANDAGECFPSVNTIAKKTRMSVRGVQQILRRLEVEGWLKTEAQKARSGCNTYRIDTSKGAAAISARPKSAPFDRYAILKRDNYTCVYCGYVGIASGQEAGSDLHVDHVIPQSRGGSSDPDNLVCACVSCNTSKKNRTPAEWAKNPSPPQDMHPAGYAPRTSCTTPPHLNVIPPARGADEPSLTIKEPKKRAMRFDEFWNVYPHRGGVKRDRKGSQAKYEKAVKDGVTEETLINAARALHQDKRVTDGFARDPKVWLNQEGWTEGIEAAPAQLKNDPMERWKRIANS